MNLLVLMLDSLRPDHTGFGGHPYVKTPAMDALAMESYVFTNAIAEYPITVPSRTALLTGHYTYTNRPWAPLADDEVTLGQRLQEAGYRTCAFSDSPMGEGTKLNRGFDEFHWFAGSKCLPPINPDREVSLDGVYIPPDTGPFDEEYYTNSLKSRAELMEREGIWFPEILTREAVKWLEQNATKGKFLLWIDWFNPHEPWDPPEPYASMYADPNYKGRQIPMPGMYAARITAEELKHIVAQYDGCVTQADDNVATVLDAVKRLGLWDDTIVVLLSDHGEPFGEHGTIRKFDVPVYDELAKMVFTIRVPGKKGRPIDALVQNTDFTPTILNLLGIEPHETEGYDLVPLIRGEVDEVREFAYSGAFQVRQSVRTREWKFIDNRGEKENELFNLIEDPHEKNNLAEKEPVLCKKLHRELWEFGLQWSRQRTWRNRPGMMPRWRIL